MLRLRFLLISCTILLSGCSSDSVMNETAANQFQSLSKNQQAAYWQAIRHQHNTAELEQLGIGVFNNGEEYQLEIPAKLLFIGATPMTAANAADVYHKIAKLINGEPTSRLRISTYSNTGNTLRDYALTESWAQTVQTDLRDAGCATAIINAVAKGTCQQSLDKNSLSAHIEIHYRIQQID